jgi:hypothetical protein
MTGAIVGVLFIVGILGFMLRGLPRTILEAFRTDALCGYCKKIHPKSEMSWVYSQDCYECRACDVINTRKLAKRQFQREVDAEVYRSRVQAEVRRILEAESTYREPPT